MVLRCAREIFIVFTCESDRDSVAQSQTERQRSVCVMCVCEQRALTDWPLGRTTERMCAVRLRAPGCEPRAGLRATAPLSRLGRYLLMNEYEFDQLY